MCSLLLNFCSIRYIGRFPTNTEADLFGIMSTIPAFFRSEGHDVDESEDVNIETSEIYSTYVKRVTNYLDSVSTKAI